MVNQIRVDVDIPLLLGKPTPAPDTGCIERQVVSLACPKC
jgi:hypothetical protein